MTGYGFVDAADEDAIHGNRLLGVEDKFLKRLQRRFFAPDSPLNSFPQSPPTPPPDSEAVDESAAVKVTENEKQLQDQERWREEVLIDFAAFESSIKRVQFLLRSNERERQRYAQEKQRILETAELVRERNVQLHQKLQQAQATLAQRKVYDDMAEVITKNPALKPRDEQNAAIEKLHREIAALEQEGEEYVNTWCERRDQFGRIVEEGELMLRLIRGEKDEAERQGSMEVEDDGTTPRFGSSRAATPKLLYEVSGAESRLETNKPLEAIKYLERLDVPTSSGTSRATTPVVPAIDSKADSTEDTPMAAIDVDPTGLEEGEEEEVVQGSENMDVN